MEEKEFKAFFEKYKMNAIKQEEFRKAIKETIILGNLGAASYCDMSSIMEWDVTSQGHKYWAEINCRVSLKS